MSLAHVIRRLQSVGLLTLLAVMPLFFGGNRTHVVGGALIGVGLLLVLHAWSGPLKRALPWPALMVAVGLVLLKFVYLLPMAHQLGNVQFSHLGVDALAAWNDGLRVLLIAVACYLFASQFKTSAELRIALRVLFVAGLVHAFAGSIARLMDWRWTNDYLVFGFGMGGYVNENHFAGYLQLSLAFGIMLLISELSFEPRNQTQTKSLRQRLRELAGVMLSSKMVIRLGLVVLVIALVLSTSRGGNLAFFSALVIAGALTFSLLPQRPPALLPMLISLVLVDLCVVGVWFGADRVAERLALTRIELSETVSGAPLTSAAALGLETQQATFEVDRERPGLAWSALRLWQQAPWLGLGPGAFRALYPAVRPDHLSEKYYDHTHNDWVELLLEHGVLGATVVLGALSYCVYCAIWALRHRQNRLAIGAASGSLLGLFSLSTHALFDFNAHIPANLLLFVILCWIAVWCRHGKRRVRTDSQVA